MMRNVASASDSAKQIQMLDLEMSGLWNQHWSRTQDPDTGAVMQTPSANGQFQSLAENRASMVQSLSQSVDFGAWSGAGPAAQKRFDEKLFDRDETFTVTNMNDYSINRRTLAFPLEHRLFKTYLLRLENRLPLPETLSPESHGTTEPAPLEGKFECDGVFLHPSGFLTGLFGTQKWSRSWEFEWHSAIVNGQKLGLQFHQSVNRCVLQYRSQSDAQWTHAVEFAALDVVSPAWLQLMTKLEVCARPQENLGKGPEAFFWQQDFNHVTCPQRYEKMESLPDPVKALNAKIRGLTGSNLPVQAVQDRNPVFDMDFSKAPKFDLIWVSSLNFSADFYGSVLAKALRYHALRGTQVRILVPAATIEQKDAGILKSLMQELPNIKLQYYSYNLAKNTEGNWIDTFHRVNHAKLLIGYSAQNPNLNFVVTGGRNISDPFLFHDKPNYQQYPWLSNYASGERRFIHFVDFEFEFRGRDVVESTLAQMMTLWNRNVENQLMRSTNLNLKFSASLAQLTAIRTSAQKRPLMRHLLSVPYVDGFMLKKFYVKMIDSAESEIFVTTPYFTPPPEISAALDRAAARGVDVKLLTSIRLAGDDIPKIAQDINRKGVNRHWQNLEVHSWTEPNSILHAKLMVIDRKLTFSSSVNLNMRSFHHDIESGVLILDEKKALEVRQQILEFLKKSETLTSHQKIKWLNGIILDRFESYF